MENLFALLMGILFVGVVFFIVYSRSDEQTNMENKSSGNTAIKNDNKTSKQ